MGQISAVLRSIEGDRLGFWCPGCEEMHAVRVGDGPHPRWGYNGNPSRPTFTPSIFVTSTDFTEKGRADYEAWYAAGCPKLEGGHKFESRPTVCHSFVRDGQIQFLGDCTHALAGKTVPLPPLPTYLTDEP